MPEDERSETLGLLERNRREVEGVLAALPITGDTLSMVRLTRGGEWGCFGAGWRGQRGEWVAALHVIQRGGLARTCVNPVTAASQPTPPMPSPGRTTHRPQRRRKDDLERRLVEIDEACRVFSRKQVLVRM